MLGSIAVPPSSPYSCFLCLGSQNLRSRTVILKIGSRNSGIGVAWLNVGGGSLGSAAALLDQGPVGEV